MLKILFSPSEGKNIGGDAATCDIFGSNDARKNILQTYNEIVNSNNEEKIKTLFGIKNFQECKPYIVDIFNTPLMSAIERYDGVAYDYLSFNTLNTQEQQHIYENTIIFSNLFGPLLAKDPIPIYKVKQGNSIGDIAPDKFYKERFSYQLDLYLADKEILDLRAGYYDKFYKPNKPFTTLKFLKNGKSVSHWAKAYRGRVLREIAKNNISSLKALQKLEIENLAIKEIKIIKNKTEIVYNILEN